MKTLLLLVFSFLIVSYGNAQQANDKAPLTAESMVFYGLDLSHSKMVGSIGFTDPQAIVTTMFPSWNGIMVGEKEKYNLEKAFKKKLVTYEIDKVSTLNSKVDPKTLVTDNESDVKPFTQEDLQNMVNKYELTKKDGYGLVFIVESFNKFQEKAVVHVVFINNSDKKIAFSRKMEGKARGIGVRNYWLGSIYDILNLSRDQYSKWLKS